VKEHLANAAQIPLTVLEANEARIKEVAKGCDGRINWPGVAVSEDFGTTTRR
jgi:hypothetical protein